MNTTSAVIRQPIVIVSGLPRSGTSMMMRMLAAGGVPLVTDDARQPDPSNPLGFFEDERVKQLPRGDAGWLADAAGCAVKVVSPLLRFLPPHYPYDVLFMQRPIEEVMASQATMLKQRGAVWDASADDRVRADYTRHLTAVQIWIAAQPYMRTLNVPYADVVSEPATHAAQIAMFLRRELDVPAMAAAVDRALHRQRSAQPA